MRGILQNFFEKIGVTLNGDAPWDIKIHNSKTLNRIIQSQSIGAGESYMEGWWDCDALDELFFRICRQEADKQIYSYWKLFFTICKNALINQQSPIKSEQIVNRHYNLGNTLYEKMLGKSMAYTCGYWKDAENLDQAQFAKYDLICKKLQLNDSDTVLEIGCGWGGLAKYMAETYGCKVVAVDITSEPSRYAKKLCENLPVEIFQCDYRATSIYNQKNQKFSKIVSVGVLEHVGYKNYDHLLSIARSFIQDDGIFLLHSIGGNISKNFCEPWINKYIFPNGMLPSLKQLGKAFERKFIVEDLHNFGAYYDKTLLAWNQNLNNHWDALKDQYDEKFHRMMNYYLLSCAGGFRARSMQLWQFVLTPEGLINGYQSIR